MSDLLVHDFDLATVCTALNAATANVAASTGGYRGRATVDFDKVTSGTLATAGVYVTLAGPMIRRYSFIGEYDQVCLVMDPQDITNIASVHLCIGSSASNYLMWSWADSTFTADRWNVSVAYVGDGTATGLGCDFGTICYVAVYVTFDATTSTLADMHVARATILPRD